jgi:hypothetical protein
VPLDMVQIGVIPVERDRLPVGPIGYHSIYRSQPRAYGPGPGGRSAFVLASPISQQRGRQTLTACVRPNC